MADDPTLYRARAAAEQANADAAGLDNVRERATRAAKAWTEMADRADRTLALRHTREAATRAAVATRDQLLSADPDEISDEDFTANGLRAATS